jgi:hypothetical protein
MAQSQPPPPPPESTDPEFCADAEFCIEPKSAEQAEELMHQLRSG